MSNVVFVKTLTDYSHSYFDYHRLVELSGYPLISIADVPREGVKDTTFIVSPYNGEWDTTGIPTDGRVILWDLEYRRGPLPPIPGATEMWHMDAGQAKLTGMKYVPIGSHRDLWRMDYKLPMHAPGEDAYDVAYYGYMTNRRQAMRQFLLDRGLRLTPNANGTFDGFRYNAMKQSRAYVLCHQNEDMHALPGLRLAVAASYSIPVITESVRDPGIFTSSVLLQSDYAHMADFAQMWLRGKEDESLILSDLGRNLHGLLCERYTFQRMIESNV